MSFNDGSTWDILQAESHYIITYKGRPVGIRVSSIMSMEQGFRYKKLSYTGLGSALAQVKRLNHRFKCQDFDVMEVC